MFCCWERRLSFFLSFFSPFGQIQLHTYYDVGAAIVDGDVVLCNKLLSCARLSWCIKATSFLFSFLLGFVSFFSVCVKKRASWTERGGCAQGTVVYSKRRRYARPPSPGAAAAAVPAAYSDNLVVASTISDGWTNLTVLLPRSRLDSGNSTAPICNRLRDSRTVHAKITRHRPPCDALRNHSERKRHLLRGEFPHKQIYTH